MRLKLITIWLLVMILVFPAAASGKLAPGDFIDIKINWAEQEIQTAYNLGLMKGTGVTAQGFKLFAPAAKVTRAQLTSVLVRTFKLDFGDIRFIKEPLASDYYSDVNNRDWYAGDVVICAVNNIFLSKGDRSFLPNATVTRIELAVAIQHSFKVKNIVVPMIMIMPAYQDMTGYSREETNAMAFVSNTGIMKGDGKLFRPGDAVTRAELAVIMTRCLSL